MKNVFHSIAEGSAVLLGSRAILKIFSFVSFYLITKTLSLHDYGLVTLALSISGPVLALTGLGLDDLLFARGARHRGEKRLEDFYPTYQGFLYVKLAILAVIVALLFGMHSLLGDQYRETLQLFFVPLVVWIAINVVRAHTDATLQMFEKFRWFAVGNIVEGIAKMILILGLFLAYDLTLASVLWSYVFAKSIGTILGLPILLHGWRASGTIWASVRAYAAYVKSHGKWETVRALLGHLFSGVNQWIVGAIAGLDAVALLSFAGTMNSLVVQALPFRQVLFPILSRISHESGAISFVSRRLSKYSVWLNAILVVVSIALAGPVVHLVVAKYDAAVPLFCLLVFSQMLNAISTSHGTLFYALSEQKFLLKLSVFGTVSSLTVLPLFVWLFGAAGSILENHFSTGVIIWLREKRLRVKHQISTFVWGDLLIFDAYDRDMMKRLWNKALFWKRASA